MHSILLITDSFFLSQVSDQAAAAVGSLVPFLTMAVFIANGFVQIGGSVAAQWMGAKQTQNVATSYFVIMVTSVGLGLLISVFFWLIKSHLGGWLNLSFTAQGYALDYLIWVGSTFFLVAIRLAYTSILMINGHPSWNTRGMVLSVLTNILLNYWFLKVGFGVIGVAIATVLSNLLFLIFVIVITHGYFRIHTWCFQQSKDFYTILKRVFKLGLPSVMEPVSYSVSQGVLVAIIALLGEDELAARTYVNNLAIFCFSWAIAIGSANQVFTAHLIGQKEFQQVSDKLYSSLWKAMTGPLVISLFIYFNAELILGIFTENPQIIEFGKAILLINCLRELFRPLSIVIAAALRSAGDARYTALMSIGITWGISIPLGYAVGISWNYGLLGIWLVLVLDELLRGLMNLHRWSGNHWQTMGVLNH